MEVFQAQIKHLEEISKLFDRYRVFYKASSDPDAARTFLQERFQNGDSIIFAVRHDRKIVGFTQLYPSFSSVSMKRIWILNDLFVEPTDRQKGRNFTTIPYGYSGWQRKIAQLDIAW